MDKSISDRISGYLLAILIIWSGFTVVYAYHTQDNVQGFSVTVDCADQSEACEDAIEDVNQGIID